MNYIIEFIRSIDRNTIQIAAAWIISTVLFSTLVIYISKHPEKRTKLLKTMFMFMFLGGMAIYCYCHFRELSIAVNSDKPISQMLWVKNENQNASLYYVPYVIIRALMDVGAMFYGRCNTELLYRIPEAKIPFVVFSFWLINLLTFYTTASALLIRFGKDLLRYIRIRTSRISAVDIIFGVNQESVTFGRNISDIKGCMLVYVDSVIGEDYETSIANLGGVAYSDKDAMNASPSFLKNIRIKPRKTRVRLYAISSEYDKNLHYARMMSDSLQKLGVLPEHTELVLLGTDEWKGMFFQSSDTKYGYGSVMSFDEREMTSRLLMNKYPLCNVINFDSNGRAIEDINVLIVGFGRIGHEVLRKVIANGQFEGSNFHATVWDPNFENRTGFFRSQYPNMFANYDIAFEPHGGRGNKIFKFLQDNAARLNYIVICLDDRDTARDIAVHMVDRLQTMGYTRNVYTCDSKSVRCYSQYAKECETYWIYDSELLYSGELDKYAMALNHCYFNGKNAQEDWKQCDYFGRMSSRASVDYLIPLIRMIKTKTHSDSLTHEQRENLAKSEHLRWCAFHYTFGFDVMSREEFIDRIKARQNEIREHGQSKMKTTKDIKALKHVCLVDWDELDEISQTENSITNGNRDYKENDRINVDMVGELIKGDN